MKRSDKLDMELLKGLLIGGIAGAVATLLAIPSTNRKIRAKLSETSDEFQEQASKRLDEAREKADHLLKETESQIEQLRQNTETAMNTIMSQTNEAISKSKDAVVSKVKWMEPGARDEQPALVEESDSFLEQWKERGSNILEKGKQIIRRDSNGSGSN